MTTSLEQTVPDPQSLSAQEAYEEVAAAIEQGTAEHFGTIAELREALGL